ncbi:MAG: hypothetical protein HY611_07940 [Elusimicrobia bacterium]|nr:hypothetical protein [Elusimicrobiota bacterium]
MKLKRQTGCFAAFLGLAALLAPAMPRAAGFSGPDFCSGCHAEEHAEWKGSIHARAYASKKFQKEWKENGANPRCLECHTTGHRQGSQEFLFAGVTCESCHGPAGSSHPADAKMPIPASADMCKRCHRQTYQEWTLSRHGQKNIRCFDCHRVHAQGLRAGGKNSLCGSCHPGRMKDFAHATHHLEGLTCVTCHMSAPKTTDAIEGTGAAGHSLAVGVEVCSRCHEEMVHKSANLPRLRDELSDLRKQLSVAGVKSVFEVKEKAEDLQWRLDRARQSLWLTALLGLLAGLALGWLAGWVIWRARGGPHA